MFDIILSKLLACFSPTAEAHLKVPPDWELSASLINHFQSLAISISSPVSWYTLAKPLRATLCLQPMSAAAVCSRGHKSQSQYIRLKRNTCMQGKLLMVKLKRFPYSSQYQNAGCYSFLQHLAVHIAIWRHHWTVTVNVQRQQTSQTPLHSTSNLHASGKTSYSTLTSAWYILVASFQFLQKH